MNMFKSAFPFFVLELRYTEDSYSQIIAYKSPPIGRILAASYLFSLYLSCALWWLGSGSIFSPFSAQ